MRDCTLPHPQSGRLRAPDTSPKGAHRRALKATPSSKAQDRRGRREARSVRSADFTSPVSPPDPPQVAWTDRQTDIGLAVQPRQNIVRMHPLPLGKTIATRPYRKQMAHLGKCRFRSIYGPIGSGWHRGMDLFLGSYTSVDRLATCAILTVRMSVCRSPRKTQAIASAVRCPSFAMHPVC